MPTNLRTYRDMDFLPQAPAILLSSSSNRLHSCSAQTFLPRVPNGIFIAFQCGKGRKLGCTVPHRHPRMVLWLVMWQIDNIVVIIYHFSFLLSHLGRRPLCVLLSVCCAPWLWHLPRSSGLGGWRSCRNAS